MLQHFIGLSGPDTRPNAHQASRQRARLKVELRLPAN
jgi:hypothetical protein